MIAIGAVILVVTVSAPYGCSLGLDASKIGDSGTSSPPKDDASVPPVADGSSADVTATADSEAEVPAEAGADADAGTPTCSLDTECIAPSGCQVGACDAGACSFAVCPTSACQGSSCSLATNTCTPPVTYGFHAAQVNVTLGAVGCGGNVGACVAAAYPLVFVGTANGVIAYNVSDPSTAAPRVVPITGLAFLPSFLAAMGSRVFVVGTPQGSGPSYRLAIATIEVPADPLTVAVEATTAFEVVSITSLAGAWATTDGSLFLANGNAAQSLPVAHATPPLGDGASLAFDSSTDVPAGAFPVVASGSRLVMAHWLSASLPYQTAFSFETSAGTTSAHNSGDTSTLAAIGPTGPQSTYAQGTDGSVVWNTGTSTSDDAGGSNFGGVRVAWLVADGTSAFAPAHFVNVQAYAPPVPYGTPVVGPVAWIDPITALVLAASAQAISAGTAPATVVQLAVSTPSPKLVPARTYTINQSVSLVGATASGGYGYVLAAGAAGVAGCTLHVFAPGCATP